MHANVDSDDILNYIWTSDLDPLFWRHARTGVLSAWYGHIPFAHWIIEAVRPRMLVELGTHNGVSYSAFCEAVVRLGLDARCCAVDTWKGDAHAGFYNEDVYLDFRRFHDQRYAGFSELLRCTFDEAVHQIADGAIDLLHIDGVHTYEAVMHDFETWQPKLSDRAVVLLHDTNVRTGDFGVWRLWEELRLQFPHFEFLHGHGLGVLAVGNQIVTKVRELCSVDDSLKIAAIRQRFAFLGDLLAQREDLQTREIAARDQHIQALKHELTTGNEHIKYLEAQAARQSATEQQLRLRAAESAKNARIQAIDAIAKKPVPEKSFRRQTSSARVLYISGEPNTPGHLYRVVRAVEAAVAAGAQASWIRVEDVEDHMKELASVDILVIWRAAWSENLSLAVATARRRGARVVFDVDDLMVDPELAKVEIIDGIRTQYLSEQQVQEHYTRCQRTLRAADFCTAPTEELAARLRRLLRPALVLPNGFDYTTYTKSRRACRERASQTEDGLVRIGYAGGSRTHQRDFAVAAEAVARVLHERPHSRLVLFRSSDGSVPVLDVAEFPAFDGLASRIEWHNFVPLRQLPEKVAQFDINLAPLEVNNPFCESKSELKFFEAALVNVPTIASPTGPFRRAIRNGVTGFLANQLEEWHAALIELIDNPRLRHRIARTAHNEVLWRYGPLRRAQAMLSALPQMQAEIGSGTRGFALELYNRAREANQTVIPIPETEKVFESDRFGETEVTVVIPLYNYAHFVEEALESVRVQTHEVLDLIIINDASTDDSLSMTINWAKRHTRRFNRILVLSNKVNSGLGPTRNVGFDAADTPFVLPLDADNRLLPECVATCLSTIHNTAAAFAYPGIRTFGDEKGGMGIHPFEPARFSGYNYIDAMALVAKEAWVAAGGYQEMNRLGWEDYDFWCRLIEKGLWGVQAGTGPLAEYRVHANSMLKTVTHSGQNAWSIVHEIERRHPWTNAVTRPNQLGFEWHTGPVPERLRRLISLLRCPESGQPLRLGTDGALHTVDGVHLWPLVEGRPNLFPGLAEPAILPELHYSNQLSDTAVRLIEGSHDGLVLNLSAGGTGKRFEHVIEVEAAVFRHTDVLADAHALPFQDATFDAVIAFNAFEHYRDPRRVAQELFRILKPGGTLMVRTAFLQPLHEKPWHFYNCTRYGLEQWFKDFETVGLSVSDNFSPGYSLSWLASECEAALRRDISPEAADAFNRASMEQVLAFWRKAEARETDPIWRTLAKLPQEAQESIAAGFEYVGRRPLG